MSTDDPSSKKPSTETSGNKTKTDTPTAVSLKSAFARLPVLQSPGPDSNFLDWELVITAYFDSLGINYVIDKPLPNHPTAAWTAYNKTVCAILTQTIDSSNLIAIRPYKQNTYGMWGAIVRAHQDSSTGGRVYWLRKLLLTKMEGDDVLSHINTMAKAYDHLNSLVTTNKPLTVADVHSAALLSSIPDDWMGCVSHLMNQEGTKSHTGKQLGNQNKKSCHCDFCNADGHDLNNCNNTRHILDKHKASQKARTDSKDQDRKPNQSSKPAARAGRTLAVTLGGLSHAYDEDDESNYSGSKIEITAGNAVASLSVSKIYSGTGDAKLDSGCSMSMTPDILSVENPKTDCTPVRLADHSVVEATHRGISRLPIDGETKDSRGSFSSRTSLICGGSLQCRCYSRIQQGVLQHFQIERHQNRRRSSRKRLQTGKPLLSSFGPCEVLLFSISITPSP
ncbi:uncharacterized protein PGTG_17299 [Puccinia graminis f. sp. tritici CRL 75-36-700-3]|uniref:Uncharacterized protein n=1 Tax=Puccinia graminis f. sp. tritici (strain CRL 75-36-700-3 / race SCCL) TaxID=418459 RepID=E3L3A2_PUCGT|nr:uncharacterized protein PGTG_17299 [Puccinia graminis f. sp. tritici CRL 75-36-700-3]EFP91027.1 hypothetical protein PGTG_17299 [Puccinia graminis f. sp. tritici CRL 75-36-700-3]